MKRLTLSIIAASLLAAACGSRAGSLGPAPTAEPTTPSPEPTATSPAPTESPTTSPTPTTGRQFTFEVWFEVSDRLFATKRTEPFDVAVAALATAALVDGPSSAEAAAGVSSEVPSGTTFRITALKDSLATIEFDPGFYEGPDDVVRFRQAQVVYTLTQYATIETVQFTRVGGDRVFGQQGRDDFEDLLPAILVEQPLIGSRASNPVTVSGTANVFEATVSLRILDSAGNEIARTFTTATCGTGCRGGYSVSIAYSIDHEQSGTVEVFESSAKDGSPINVVQIPVILTA
jgi:hypothetical protein